MTGRRNWYNASVMPKSRLVLLTGPAGSGKTSRLIQHFRRRIARRPFRLGRPSYFIVPTHEHKDRIVSLLLRDETLEGLAGPHVMTINDFIRFKVQSKSQRTVSHFERVWIIRDILVRGKWQWIRNDDIPMGLVHAFSDFVREMKQAGFSARTFASACAASRDPSAFFDAKRRDLTLLAERYEAHLKERGLRDPEDEMRAYAFSRRPVPLKDTDCLVIDGFYHFTKLQLAFFKRAFLSSREVWVALSLRKGREKLHTFRYPEDTRLSLLRIGFRELEPPRPRKDPRRHDLEHLERYLFRDRPVKKHPPRHIKMLKASSVRQEVQMIARAILGHQRQGPYAFSDFMIILRDIRAHRGLIESIFGSFGIPYEIHERKRLTEDILIRILIRWMNLFRGAGPFGNDAERRNLTAIVELLRAGYPGFTVSQADEIERGLGLWNEAPPFEPSLLGEHMTEVGVSQGACEAFAGLLSSVERYLSIPDALACRDFYEGFVSDCLKPHEGRERSYDSTQALEAFAEILETESSARSRVSFDIRGFTERLAGNLEMGLYSVSHKDKNRVQVYDVTLAKEKEYRIVFVSGLTEGSFPQRIFQDPILKDQERERLSRGSLLFDTRSDRADGERYFFYIAVTRAREFLYLTGSELDPSGREVMPSRFIQACEDCFKGPIPRIQRGPSDLLPTWEEARGEDFLGLVSYGFFHEGREPDFKDLCYVISGLPGFGGRDDLVRWLERLEATRAQACLSDDRALREIRSGQRVFSATELETLFNCGYQHFAKHILKIPGEEESSPALQDGRIVHRVMEEVYEQIFLKGRSEAVLSPGELGSLFVDRMRTVFPEFPVKGEMPYRTAIRRVRLERILKRLARFEHEHQRLLPEWRPLKVEFGFGLEANPGDPGPLRIRNHDLDALIRGKIDRIDIGPQGDKAMVIDYKAGRSFRLSRVEEGRDMQMPVYIWAARELLGLNVVGAESLSYTRLERRGLVQSGYYPDQVARRKRLVDRAAFEGILDRSRNKIIEAIRKFHEADIRARPRTCEHCVYYGMCRYESWPTQR